jgi:uncharacterized protein (DUF849 family)
MLFTISRKQASEQSLWSSLQIGALRAYDPDERKAIKSIKEAWEAETHLNSADTIFLSLPDELSAFAKQYFSNLGVRYSTDEKKK